MERVRSKVFVASSVVLIRRWEPVCDLLPVGLAEP